MGMDGRTDGWTDGWMGRCMHACVHAVMDACMLGSFCLFGYSLFCMCGYLYERVGG